MLEKSRNGRHSNSLIANATRSPSTMSDTNNRDAGAQRLPELCSELFAFALSLRSAKDPGEAEPLFATVERLLEQLGKRARNAGVDSAHLDAARYAFCALIDETVLGSRWEIKSTWMSKPLQLSYYGDFTAGEQFYQRLEGLRGDPTHNIDAIEIYAQCLAAGFRGKYADLAGMQKVDDLLAELGEQIRSTRGLHGRALSKTFVRSDVVQQGVRQMPVWIMAAAGAGLLLLVLFLLDGLLSSQASEFLETGKVAR
ncbi:MAG: type VI secretion system protein ImpK [Planctomycetota bacterium]|jgi:type VI secretion system protein ImpK